MKHIKLFESMTEIKVEKICKKYDIENWTLNSSGLVDVDGDVNLAYQGLSKLPLKFGRVTGNFWCSYNQLTSLEGCPKEIGEDFSCHNNNLTSLEGCPTEIGGDFFCSYNQLTTLEGCPTEIGGSFWCSKNQLTSLEGCPPEIRGNFWCQNNKLTSLENCPKEIGGNFSCHTNQLTSLKGAPEYIEGQVNFIPNNNLPVYIKQILKLNDNNKDIQKYILKWQKDYDVWRRDGSFNQARFILMMEDAGDELKNLKLPE
jgi:hypothetical protein